MDLGLKGKMAVVTGGSGGIGKGIARTLAEEGVDVAIVARDQRRLEAVALELTKETGRCIVPISVDVTQSDQVESMMAKAASALGSVDILVNIAGAAGGLARGPLPNVTDAAMMMDLDVKLMGYLRCMRAAAPYMQKRGWGRIVNIGGISARKGGSYSAGIRNIGIVHLSKTLSLELGPYGITVNVVNPGGTRNTPSVDRDIASRSAASHRDPEEIALEMARELPIRRMPDLQDITNLVVFLASPRAGAITGEVISVAGGEVSMVLT